MPKMTLQEQMLKAGLVNKKQVRKAKKGAKKQSREVQASIEEKKAEQLARDKALNKEIQEKRLAKEIQAQIKQLIESNKIDTPNGDIKYNFTDGTLIKALYVDETTRKQLMSGILVVASFAENYSVIPAVVGRKIAERDETLIIENKHAEEITAEDDPYADFVVPDDLMW
ncbi:MAG: DUF2058 domain-containing protein [Pseudomonadota bacterium]